MVEKDVWMISGNRCRKVSSNFTISDKLPVGVYNIDLVPFVGWVVDKYADKFEFDYKLYDLEDNFINHICKTYKETSGNLGILLNGTKGTGKTVSAKVLANKLNLPVIIVKSFGDRNQDLIQYLSTLDCDCIFFFDEFEKNFHENDSTILQIMDGVYNSGNRKVFLLTTNTMTINDNLIGRPSRIRYVKTFGNLDLKVVKSYLNDNLADKSCIDEVVEFIDSLTISTIDILKSIVNEINIHGIEDFRESKEFFNVKSIKYNYQIYVSSVNMVNYSIDKESGGNEFTTDKFVEFVNKKREFEEARLHTFDLKEFDKIRDDFDDYRRKCPFDNISLNQLESSIKFFSLREGMKTEYGNIIHIDYDKKVIITRDNDEDCYEQICFIYCINPNSKPSLYNSYARYTNY